MENIHSVLEDIKRIKGFSDDEFRTYGPVYGCLSNDPNKSLERLKELRDKLREKNNQIQGSNPEF